MQSIVFHFPAKNYAFNYKQQTRLLLLLRNTAKVEEFKICLLIRPAGSIAGSDMKTRMIIRDNQADVKTILALLLASRTSFNCQYGFYSRLLTTSLKYLKSRMASSGFVQSRN